MDGLVYRLNVKRKIAGEMGIPKIPVPEVYFSFKGLNGDYNNFRTEKKASTLDRAVLILPFETIRQLNLEGWIVEPGHLGDNVTSIGIAYDSFVIGKKYNLGDARVEITEVCKPCTVLSNLSYVGECGIKNFMKTLIGRRGRYARVIKEGNVKVNDKIEEIFI